MKLYTKSISDCLFKLQANFFPRAAIPRAVVRAVLPSGWYDHGVCEKECEQSDLVLGKAAAPYLFNL